MDLINGFLTPVELTDILGDITVHGVYKILNKQNIKVLSSSTKRKKIPPVGVRMLLKQKGFSFCKLNISFQIVKGGVGKTSLSYALGMRAYHYGARVLLVDLDQQGNLTRSFNIEARSCPVLLNLIRDGLPIQNAIIKISDNLDILPSNLNNSRLDTELTQASANLKDLLKNLLDPIRDNYDLVIFDCPPAINKINLSATCASDLVIIPLNPDPYAMDGLDFTLNELNRIKKEFKLNFDFKIVWNRYDARERLGAFYMHSLAKDEEKMQNTLPVVIRVDTALKNSIFDSRTIFDLPKNTAIREDIDQFTKEILGINQWKDSFIEKRT